MNTKKNIFANVDLNSGEETFEDLLSDKNCRIERIVSTGQSSPEGFWYNQDEDEWVILLSGGAVLSFEAKGEHIELYPGDYLHIPAHAKHRVEKTESPSVWLAVFIKKSE